MPLPSLCAFNLVCVLPLFHVSEKAGLQSSHQDWHSCEKKMPIACSGFPGILCFAFIHVLELDWVDQFVYTLLFVIESAVYQIVEGSELAVDTHCKC